MLKQLMMVLAGATLAGALAVTGAQAMSVGFGGGHIVTVGGGFGGGHMGGGFVGGDNGTMGGAFGGGHIGTMGGGFGGRRIGSMGGGFGGGGGLGAVRLGSGPGFALGFHAGRHQHRFRRAHGYGYGYYNYGYDGCDIDRPYRWRRPPYCCGPSDCY